MSGSRYFEDLEVGDVSAFGRYPVSEQEIVDFISQFDPQPWHFDAATVEAASDGGPAASGWHTASMMMRMIADDPEMTVGAIASFGFDELRWLRPVKSGDVLSVRSTVVEKVPSRSKPDRGTVKLCQEVLNQDAEVVMSLLSLVLYRRRPEADAQASASG